MKKQNQKLLLMYHLQEFGTDTIPDILRKLQKEEVPEQTVLTELLLFTREMLNSVDKRIHAIKSNQNVDAKTIRSGKAISKTAKRRA